MPYRLSENGLCVQQQDDSGKWQNKKCYESKDDARKYLGALQANVDDYKGARAMETTQTEQVEQTDKNYGAPAILLSQEEAGYIIDATRKQPLGQMCKSCRFFEYPGACHIVMAFPEPIYPDGWCTWWTAKPKLEPEPLEVVIVEPDMNEDDSQEYAVGTMARYGVDVALPVWDRIEGRGFLQRDKVDRAFKVLPDGRWLACHTNNFLDSDDEILKAKAHKDYVARVKAKLVEPPDLWLGHIDGTAHGKAQYVDYIETDGVITVFAIGTFEDTPAGKSARRYYEKAKPGEVSLSHGFLFPTWAKKNGEYEVYNTFEISTLKRGQEANAFTNFSVEIKDKNMPLQETQIEDIKKVFGEAAPEIIKRVEARGKADKSLADLGAKYKGFTDFADVSGTDSAANKGQDATTMEAFKALVPTLLEDSGTFLELLQAMDKRLDAAEKAKNEAQETRIKALETELATVKQLLLRPSTSASESAATVLDGQVTPEMLKQVTEYLAAKQNGNAQHDPFFGDLKVPVKR